MKCCAGQHRKGNMIHIMTFTGIEGREVILRELCCLKLFKGTHSLLDILGRSKYRSDTLEESTVMQYIQGWANRTLYTVFLINWRLTALLLCSTQLCSAHLSLAFCFEYSQPYSYVIFSSCAVVRSLLSHQCGPGPNPGVDAICELSLLLSLLCSEILQRFFYASTCISMHNLWKDKRQIPWRTPRGLN